MHVAMRHQSPLHGGRVGGGGSEHKASMKGKLKSECKIHATNSLENREEKQKVVDSDNVDNLNGIDKESRSKILIKIPALTPSVGNNVVDKEGYQLIVDEQNGEEILQGGGDHELVVKNRSLRARRSGKKTLNVDDGGGGGGGVGLKGGEGSGSAHVANNVNDIDNMSIDEESRSKIVIKIPVLTRNIGNNVVDKDGDQVKVNEQNWDDDELVGKIWNLRPRRQVKKSWIGDDGDGFGVKGGDGGSGSVHEKKDQLLQENLENGNNVVDNEEYQVALDENKGEKILQGGEDDEPMAKNWNLRPRRQVKRSSNVDDEGGGGGGGGGVLLKGGGSGSVHEKKDQFLQMNSENGTRARVESRLNGFDKEKKVKFSLSLTRQEIDEDIYSFTGSKASRRPKKRAKVVQKYLDNVFPGESLAYITPDSYKVSSMKG